MTICPFCDYKNIEGADTCDRCHQPLSDLYLRDPANAVERSLLKDTIVELNPRTPVAVPPDTSVRDALRLLVEKGIGCVLVVQAGKVEGIFSERDALLKLNADAAKLGDRPVRDFMTAAPQTLDLHAKVAFAVHRMVQGSYRHVPIVDENKDAQGIISARDILRYLTERMASSRK